MKIAYFDCFSGASGDMILGALVDAGLDTEVLSSLPARLGIEHCAVLIKKAMKRGIGGTRVIVEVDEAGHTHHRHLPDIEAIVSRAAVDEAVKTQALRIFRRLGEAEARVHRIPVEFVHFHEVGAVDTIIDVVGAVEGLAALRVEDVQCSPLHVGTGMVTCSHGTFPIPAPATAELTRGIPIYATGVEGELLTPTGAAILTTLASGFGPLPLLVPEATGYGAGRADRELPNVLRVTLGNADAASGRRQTEMVAVVQTTIDDMQPQLYDYLMERLLESGVLDVFFAPVHMKKNRPGVELTVICLPGDADAVSDFLMRETTTIGVRRRLDYRVKATREIRCVETPYGPIRFKVARSEGRVVNVGPEYDDLKRAAREQAVPLKRVMDHARSISAQLQDDDSEYAQLDSDRCDGTPERRGPDEG